MNLSTLVIATIIGVVLGLLLKSRNERTATEYRSPATAG